MTSKLKKIEKTYGSDFELDIRNLKPKERRLMDEKEFVKLAKNTDFGQIKQGHRTVCLVCGETHICRKL